MMLVKFIIRPVARLLLQWFVGVSVARITLKHVKNMEIYPHCSKKFIKNRSWYKKELT